MGRFSHTFLLCSSRAIIERLHSIVETAKANDLKPYEYLKLLLSVMVEHIYDTDTACLDDLMPWSKNLPDVCKKAT